MRIKEIHVEGFGGIGPLDLSFSPGLNVIMGPNEAGKTCLMEFIRAVFFGLSKRDRNFQRYLPLDSRPYGGRMILEEGEREWVYSARFPGAPRVEGGEEPFSRETGALLFSRVFSLGLAQVSNLALLSGEEMAQHLYSTTLGPMGRSYALAVGELEKSREALFKAKGRNPEINRLLAQIRSVEGELAKLRKLPQRYREVQEELEKVEGQLREVTREWERVSMEGREWDTMARAHPLWSRLKEVQKMLDEGDFPSSFPVRGLERLESLEKEIREGERELEEALLQLTPLEEALKRPFEGGVVLSLEKEIVALREEWSLIKEKMERRAQLDARLIQLEGGIREALDFLGVKEIPPRPSGGVWERLKEFVEGFSQLEKERLALEKELEVRAGEREKGERNLEALKEQAPPRPPLSRDEVLSRQDLVSLARDHLFATPTFWQLGFSLFFVLLGGGSVGAGLRFHWPLLKWGGGVLILVGLGFMAGDVFKRVRWKAEARRLARGLEVGALDRRVLEDLERDLKAMEEAWRAVDYWKIKCHDLERSLRLASRELEEMEKSLGGLREREEGIRNEWRKWLGSLGLPEDLSPQGAREFLHRLEEVHRANQEKETLEGERDAIVTAVEDFGHRVKEVLSSLGHGDGSLEEGMVHLTGLLEKARREWEERRALEAKAAPLREKVKLIQERIRGRREEMAALLQEGGVSSPGEFREKASRWEKREALVKEVQDLRLQLATLLGGDWEERVSRLGSMLPREVQDRALDLAKTEEALRRERDGLIEARTRLLKEKEEMERERLEQLLAQEREVLLERLKEAAISWSVETLALELFRRTREVYERENQPLVLKEASRFFSTMTGGRYLRVYMPIGSQEIWVEREDGGRFSSRFLSRGTGEQLYLALSMAIMLEVAGRGLAFPVVLDDILVNFDPKRAARAVEAIGSLASRLQVLFFTCHPHIGELFSAMEGVKMIELGRG